MIPILPVINLFYPPFLPLIQTHFTKLLPYSTISHIPILLIPLPSLNPPPTQPPLFHLLSHPLIPPLLFFLLPLI
ncbi:proton-conducting transporter membrane subunit, partial [Bacillus thuringiensis]|uniref:proton-conducting transporter transmembrane domain-containing protein n=1 Tax=Bacillus thuringiensis TaxID=1428 RepID=UPI003BFA6EF7